MRSAMKKKNKDCEQGLILDWVVKRGLSDG